MIANNDEPKDIGIEVSNKYYIKQIRLFKNIIFYSAPISIM